MMMTAKYLLVDQSAGALTRGGQPMDPMTLASIAGACQRQLNVALSQHYGGTYQVRSAASADDREPDEWLFALVGAFADEPGAIAYHTVNGVGVPILFDAVTLSDTLTGPGNSVSVAISHELLETSVDPPCNIWSDAGTTETAREVADPVESSTYTEPMFRAVYLSNFVLPSWFIPNHVGPFDYMSTWMANADAPLGPFQNGGGGYQVARSSGANEHQVLGDRVLAYVTMQGVVTRRPWREGSRRARRGVPGPSPR